MRSASRAAEVKELFFQYAARALAAARIMLTASLTSFSGNFIVSKPRLRRARLAMLIIRSARRAQVAGDTCVRLPVMSFILFIVIPPEFMWFLPMAGRIFV